MVNFAVIDLGSNSIRLKISQINPDGSFTVTHQLKEMVRLSENMGEEKILQPEPIARTLKALENFKQVYEQIPDLHLEAIATAAVRQAKNQADFLKSVKKKIGVKFEVISGDQEAYLDFLGVSKTLKIGNKCLIMDTGGASTELIYVKNQKIQNLISLPFGSVTVSQEFALSEQISPGNLFRAMTDVEQKLTDIDWILDAHKSNLVALGGSNRTLAKIARRKESENDELPSLHGFQLSGNQAVDIFANLVNLDRRQREDIPGLAKIRADVIVGGLIPISLLLRVLHIPTILFSNCGLRDGTLFNYLATNNYPPKNCQK
ncbi:Ppx/GppA family phosphatase [Liquorilactobacillus sicerae]|uniref:Ppx/GppA family phosphatase n=1 Tax=Liquorilactobacillus sicerae TaxID=1416943 RepID=UPI0024810BB3|nr:Ppx/GppA family phosphatase [Liquorilactobacillus sicerae]